MRHRYSCVAVVLLLVTAACSRQPANDVLSADMPIHLEEHLDVAVIDMQVPEGSLEAAEWTFEGDPSEWRALDYPAWEAVALHQKDGALEVQLDEGQQLPGGEGYVGAIYVDLPDWRRDEWAEVLVEARSNEVEWVDIAFNLGERTSPDAEEVLPYLYRGDGSLIVRDGMQHAYRLRAEHSVSRWGEWEGPWRQLVIEFWSANPGTLYIESIRAVPKEASYAGAPAGVETLFRGDAYHRAIYSHVPGLLEFPVEVPAQARLDVGLGVLQKNRPAIFRVRATTADGESETLFEESVDAAEEIVQRSIDLSAVAGRQVRLALETEGENTVAFWTAPTLSGTTRTDRPNVIFYVIDGAGADYMSLYGHGRDTTPELAGLAENGVVFEHAYSNAAWTKPSTASFMTSLQQSVLGGFHSLHDAIPEAVTTMAEHFHRGGYQTAVFSSNPWAGSGSNLQRGVDYFRDQEVLNHSTSSVDLHEAFWQWRDSHPGQPYWVHFQPTDVHEPHRPQEPFSGRFIDDDRREQFFKWWAKVSPWEANVAESVRMVKNPESNLSELYHQRLEAIDVEPRDFFSTQEGLYEETMTHQDHQIARLVEQLEARDEWDNTLLIVAADHGHPAGSFSRFGRELLEPPPPKSEGALFDSYRTRVPLLFVWPSGLDGGLRLEQPVSMIDVLPTVLDLAGLPQPTILQGQSLVPLLRSEAGWQARPVILEQLQPAPEQGTLVGHIEIIDGRWGASLEIWPEELEEGEQVRPVGHQRAARPHLADAPPLLLYDLQEDPLATRNVNAEHPELVEKYTRILKAQWEAHQQLATQFEPGAEIALRPEQLEVLRSLGYIQ